MLRGHGVEALADIRQFPGSRHCPQFNRENLERELPARGIEYVWIVDLGGRRKADAESLRNAGLRNISFRSYADYMLTPKFEAGMRQLLDLAARKRTAMMCAEAVYWRCHRRLVSDWLLAHGVTVQHILTTGPTRPHELTPGGVIVGDHVEYPPPPALYGAG